MSDELKHNEQLAFDCREDAAKTSSVRPYREIHWAASIKESLQAT